VEPHLHSYKNTQVVLNKGEKQTRLLLRQALFEIGTHSGYILPVVYLNILKLKINSNNFYKEKIVWKINMQAKTAGSERHFVNSSFSFFHIHDSGGIERSMRKNFSIPQATSLDSFALTNP
jgi:hypothetical protein